MPARQVIAAWVEPHSILLSLHVFIIYASRGWWELGGSNVTKAMREDELAAVGWG